MANKKVISGKESRSFDRYLFDTDFFEIDATAKPSEEAASPDAHPPQPETEAPAPLTEQDLAQAESAGYAAGLEEGKKQATEDFKSHTAAFAAALADVATLKEELATTLAQKALGLLAGTLPALLADTREKYPEALLKRTAETLAEALKAEKVLTVHTAPHTTDFLIKHLATQKGIQTHLTAEQFIETPELELGDCIIEWAQGGTTLNHADILQQLTHVLTGAATATPKAQKAPAITQPEADTPLEAAPEETPEPTDEIKDR